MMAYLTSGRPISWRVQRQDIGTFCALLAFGMLCGTAAAWIFDLAMARLAMAWP